MMVFLIGLTFGRGIWKQYPPEEKNRRQKVMIYNTGIK
ncbi:hypothetical protein VIS19158_16926 [Vibrio scophthalmi LMG 19158]|uniref:Uncharacterized protein n=1 Tax=Vibrio scophthalmi LMG 19158 TaxID=870967 RepID=F9RRT0_9VIBR|nr:hypothetical protein VIS19158_16926 [Vibrio scophthalmi LMG 19158]